jgi:2-isopropylmalate synthase
MHHDTKAIEKELMNSELIFDWNVHGEILPAPARPVQLMDETLRDGLQSSSVRTPKLEEEIQLLHLMNELGISVVNIGLPGAGGAHVERIKALGREIRDHRMQITATCACRTVVSDIEALVRICDELGMPIEAACFIGSSSIRRYSEEWSIDEMLKNIEASLSLAVKHGLPVMFVTEDTTRADPDTLNRLFSAAIELGAKRLCLCDTVGHATPSGVKNLVRYTRVIIAKTGRDVEIDFHGHNDRGFGVINAIHAASAGAARVHGTALGIGERCGNASMDQILVNLKLLGWIDGNMTKLKKYAHLAAEMTGIDIPVSYPVFGPDAFRTQTGVHAAAVVKAYHHGNNWLANRVYSGVPAELFGLHQTIEIGPMSGRHNVDYWLREHHLEVSDEKIHAILEAAKAGNHILSEHEIRELAGHPAADHPGGHHGDGHGDGHGGGHGDGHHAEGHG